MSDLWSSGGSSGGHFRRSVNLVSVTHEQPHRAELANLLASNCGLIGCVIVLFRGIRVPWDAVPPA